MASYFEDILWYLVFVISVLQMKSVNGNNVKIVHGCFKLQVYWSSMTIWADKVYQPSNTLDTILSCDVGSHVQIATLAYSIPKKFDNYCLIDDLINDKQKTCYENTRPKCYCCTKPEPYTTNLCTVKATDVSDLIKQCKNKPQKCSIKIKAANMRHICQDLDYQEFCDHESSYCWSRWATVLYQCIKDTKETSIAPVTTAINIQESNTDNVTSGILPVNPEPVSKKWIIIVIAFVCVLLLITVIVIAYLCYRKRKQGTKASKLVDTQSNSSIQKINQTSKNIALESDPQKKTKNKGSACVKISFHNHEPHISKNLLKDDNIYKTKDKNASIVEFVQNDYYEGHSKNGIYYSKPKSSVSTNDVDNNHYDLVDNNRNISNTVETYDNPTTPPVKVSNLYSNNKGKRYQKHLEENIYYDIPTSPKNTPEDNIYINTSPNNKIKSSQLSSLSLNHGENKNYEGNAKHKEENAEYASPKSPPSKFVDNSCDRLETDKTNEDCCYENHEFNQNKITETDKQRPGTVDEQLYYDYLSSNPQDNFNHSNNNNNQHENYV